jgi:hypothetical protein
MTTPVRFRPSPLKGRHLQTGRAGSAVAAWMSPGA